MSVKTSFQLAGSVRAGLEATPGRRGGSLRPRRWYDPLAVVPVRRLPSRPCSGRETSRAQPEVTFLVSMLPYT